jgi:hypothetical protein
MITPFPGRPSLLARRLVRVVTLAALIARPLAAQSGILNGTVLDAATNAPVRNVQVTLPGTSLATQTDEAGRFRVANVPTARATSPRGASAIGRRRCASRWTRRERRT